MKRNVILIYFICCNLCSALSQNLVTNGDFETYNYLPNSYCEWDACMYWSNVNGIKGCTGAGSPDYFHINASGGVKLPNTSAGTYLYPHTGNATMGFLTWSGSI